MMTSFAYVHRLTWKILLFASACLLVAACEAPSPGDETVAADAKGDSTAVARLQEAFMTVRDTLANIDSPAVWHGPGGEHWLLATAKEADVVVVHDASTGARIRQVGGEGTALGQLDRPNGVAVVDDLMVVVERDNARVQVFTLPGFEPLGFIGEGLLKNPYGLAVYAGEDGAYNLYVTDNYETPDEQVPPDSTLGERVQQFRFSVADGTLRREHVRAFGDTVGQGVLRVVESIAADVPNDRLMIAEEQEGRSHLKVYTLEGEFTGQMVDAAYFPNQAEGVVLYACADGGGYWIATDQGSRTNTFHVFDRTTLEHVGAFAGEATMNTDGIALTQAGFEPFAQGAFYAVHDDGNVAAFSWAEIADALGLRTDCAAQ